MATPTIRERTLYLYVLTQNERKGPGTYDSIIVAAYSRELAQRTHPEKDSKHLKGKSPWTASTSDCWASKPQLVRTRNIGIAGPKIVSPQVVHKSVKRG